jgi:phosphatidylglycerophosphate synthase
VRAGAILLNFIKHQKHHSVPKALRLQFIRFALFALAGVVISLILLSILWNPGAVWLRTELVIAGLCFVFIFTYLHLSGNYNSESSAILSHLGAANIITLLRGVIAVALLFFVGVPRPPGWLGWIPGLTFFLLALTDSLDGFVARRNKQSTKLGQKLDLTFDSVAILVAILLAISYGQVRTWFVFVGLAPFVFQMLIWLRRRLKQPVTPLSPSLFRAILGGVLFGFLCFALAPIFPSHVTVKFGNFIAAMILFSFVRDWLTIIRKTDPTSKRIA